MLYKLSPESKEAIERIINSGHKAEIGVENREIVVIDIHRKRIYPPKNKKMLAIPGHRCYNILCKIVISQRARPTGREQRAKGSHPLNGGCGPFLYL